MKRIEVDVGGYVHELIYVSDEDRQIPVHKSSTTFGNPRSARCERAASALRR